MAWEFTGPKNSKILLLAWVVVSSKQEKDLDDFLFIHSLDLRVCSFLPFFSLLVHKQNKNWKIKVSLMVFFNQSYTTCSLFYLLLRVLHKHVERFVSGFPIKKLLRPTTIINLPLSSLIFLPKARHTKPPIPFGL